MANGMDPASRGENILDIHDADGKQHVRAIIEKARSRGKGWEDYKWTNPVTKRVEPKSVYFELIDDVIVSCGIYKTDQAVRAERAAPVAPQVGAAPARPPRYIAWGAAKAGGFDAASPESGMLELAGQRKHAQRLR
jgi:hypothetical protein